jgi:serine/threonine protein phosphatase PrpC
VLSRPCEGERASGDDAIFVRGDGVLSFAVADGLGHGPQAREPAARAMQVLRDDARAAPDAILRDVHARLVGTRGAVMAGGRIDERSSRLEAASVGNVAAHVYGYDKPRRVGGASQVLGGGGPLRVAIEEIPLRPGDVIVLFTDGLSARLDLQGESDLLRQHPIVVAQRALERFGRSNDDALVMVIG